jgi:hypothetical protein
MIQSSPGMSGFRGLKVGGGNAAGNLGTARLSSGASNDHKK